LRFLFIVQGEGRGHMTQAISLSQILLRHDHQLCKVLIGQNQTRAIPRFFLKRIGAPVNRFSSPNFHLDTSRRGISIIGTAKWILKRLPSFWGGLLTIRRTVRESHPDIIVNFFEPLAGLYASLFRPRAKVVSVAHNYLLFHPQFVFPKGHRFAITAMRWFTRLTSAGSDALLALSFKKMPHLHREKIIVVPPLLRTDLTILKPSDGNFILVYVLNDGYAEDVSSWHQRHPDIQVLGFWDRQNVPEILSLHANLTFQKLDDTAFLDAMSRCRGFVSTAGFESICEAMYLGKPVYMMPTKNQIEQQCNAVDASRVGAGIWGNDFNLDRFLEYIPTHHADPAEFRKWVHSAEDIFIGIFEDLMGSWARIDSRSRAPSKSA
jgi:uncharacterized protein (TIGR00661 family)